MLPTKEMERYFSLWYSSGLWERRYSQSSVFLPRAAGEPSMMRKMEEMVIIMDR